MSAEEKTRASILIGPNPRGSLAHVSLAVRETLLPLAHAGVKHVLVALSGGADSSALALAAIDVGTRAGMQVHTLSVDHGLRHGSREEAEEVARRARHWGAQAATVSVHVGGQGGPEGAARRARRDALASHARRIGQQVPILLGHTLDDQAETVLLRLARGSGAGSLRAMTQRRVDEDGTLWLRPLLTVRRHVVRQALEDAGQSWVEDPTNEADGPWRAADGSALRRAAVRAHALPALAHALGVDPAPALARSAALLEVDDDLLSTLAGELHTKARVETPSGPVLAVVPLREAHAALRGRVVHAYLLETGARPAALSAHHVAAASALVTDWHGQGPVHLPSLVLVRRFLHGIGPALIARTHGESVSVCAKEGRGVAPLTGHVSTEVCEELDE